jgi:uncharacterized damage-inducible protein DinB
MTLERFRRELAYDDWANGEILAALERGAAPPESCTRWLAHIVGAQFLWLARLDGKASELAVWPALAPSELGRRLLELRSAWPEFLERCGPAGLARSIAYTNSKGEPWTSRVEDVLAHVTLHGAYHRGQIASALRAAGHAPPNTDYIHARRSGAVG